LIFAIATRPNRRHHGTLYALCDCRAEGAAAGAQPFCVFVQRFMADDTRAVTKTIHTIDAAAEPAAPSAVAEAFYAEAVRELSKLGLPFLLAGTYALSAW
jgi:hypothetical protein